MRQVKIVFEGSDAFYQASNIPRNIRRQVPLLLNPVNPFQNLLDIWKPISDTFFEAFKVSAQQAIQRLDSRHCLQYNLQTIFTPQRIRPISNGIRVEPERFDPHNILIGIQRDGHNCEEMLPHTVVNFSFKDGSVVACSTFFQVNQSKKYATTLGVALAGFMHAIKFEIPDISEEKRIFCVQKYFEGTFANGRCQTSDDLVDHGERFATMHIPQPEGYDLIVSFDMKINWHIRRYLDVCNPPKDQEDQEDQEDQKDQEDQEDQEKSSRKSCVIA